MVFVVYELLMPRYTRLLTKCLAQGARVKIPHQVAGGRSFKNPNRSPAVRGLTTKHANKIFAT